MLQSNGSWKTITAYEGTDVVRNKKSKRKISQNLEEKQELWKRKLLNQGTGHEYQSDMKAIKCLPQSFLQYRKFINLTILAEIKSLISTKT